ncbi:MAG: phosphopantothenoylcysteine decarboxylase [Armatimonas sp.]
MTAGGTREPIDGVRFITNMSSGKTGVAIGEAFERAGHSVTLIRAERSVAELDAACKDALRSTPIDLIIHSAAISDFVVEAVTINGVRHPVPVTGKLSSATGLSIDLVPGKKILPELKGYSQNPNVRLVGFKLTDGATESEIKAAVEKVLASGADLVVQNDLKTMHQTRATLWNTSGPQEACPTLPNLCEALLRYAENV